MGVPDVFDAPDSVNLPAFGREYAAGNDAGGVLSAKGPGIRKWTGTMEQRDREERRASNMIWNAAGDYSFQSEFCAYTPEGDADLYWNGILGAVRKDYDYPQLEKLLKRFEGKRDQTLYENLLWLGLENAAFEKEKGERPALPELRLRYAQEVLRAPGTRNELFDTIRTAHFERVLGLAPRLIPGEEQLLDALEFDASLTTEEIVDRMLHILQEYLYASPREEKGTAAAKKPFRLKIPFLRRYSFAPPQREDDNGGRGRKNRLRQFFRLRADRRERGQREQMESSFGISLYREEETSELESELCSGNHENCHLHVTRGSFSSPPAPGGPAEFQRAYARRQGEKNRSYYAGRLAQHQSGILRLTERIRNAAALATDTVRAKSGRLEAGRAWRGVYLNDGRIFRREIPGEPYGLTVDLLLDASASQLDRQEIVAAQGYMIAESLTRCGIPVRVTSFCSVDTYTVLRIFRDYRETRRNGDIFQYFAAGFNRDGLALRAALHQMRRTESGNRLLVVLSDSRPNDMHRMRAGGRLPLYRDYSEDAAVRDTAREVRNLRESGISVLCVFTGEDRDLPAARQIYGRDLVRSRSTERFADIVGDYIQKKIMDF